MKKLLIPVLVLLLFTNGIAAQQQPSAEAEAFYTKAMANINTRHTAWVKRTAATMNNRQSQPDTALTLSTEYGRPGNFQDADISALAFLVLMEAAKSAQEDLKTTMANVQHINEAKAKQRKMMEDLKKIQAQMDNKRSGATTTVQLPAGFDLSLKQADSLKRLTGIKRLVQNKYSPPRTRAELDNMVDAMKNELDSMSEMGEMESLRLQMAMDRYTKMMSTLSNILKKISRTADSIIQNLK